MYILYLMHACVVCLCVCVCVCLCMCVYMRAHICLCVCVRTHVHAHICVCDHFISQYVSVFKLATVTNDTNIKLFRDGRQLIDIYQKCKNLNTHFYTLDQLPCHLV